LQILADSTSQIEPIDFFTQNKSHVLVSRRLADQKSSSNAYEDNGMQDCKSNLKAAFTIMALSISNTNPTLATTCGQEEAKPRFLIKINSCYTTALQGITTVSGDFLSTTFPSSEVEV
jgi:hypothetical protein